MVTFKMNVFLLPNSISRNITADYGLVPFDQKILVWISEKELYVSPGVTDLALFSLEHVSHQELLDKMLNDCDEVA